MSNHGSSDSITVTAEVGYIPSFQPSSKLNAKVSIWKGDITELEVDAIVNSVHGNETVAYYGLIGKPATVADCIYKAGGKALLEELCILNYWERSEAVVTHGHRLPAKCKVASLATSSPGRWDSLSQKSPNHCISSTVREEYPCFRYSVNSMRTQVDIEEGSVVI